MANIDDFPRSRITLTYRIPEGVEQKEVNLPFRLLILGDLSDKPSPLAKPEDKSHLSKDRKVDLDKREIRRLDGTNLDKVIKDMELVVSGTVEDCIYPGDPKSPNTRDYSLKIEGMKSFTPAEIAKQDPKIKAMLLLKKLLLELQTRIDNSKEFRNVLKTLAHNPTERDALQTLLENAGFGPLTLPPGLPHEKPQEDESTG